MLSGFSGRNSGAKYDIILGARIIDLLGARIIDLRLNSHLYTCISLARAQAN
jgi:hypothetical protein